MATVPANPPAIEAVLGTAETARILGVHPRTVERRRKAVRHPGLLETQRMAKLRQIWSKRLELHTAENAGKWLRSSVPALGSRCPLEVMTEDGGLDRVLDMLARMSRGIPS